METPNIDGQKTLEETIGSEFAQKVIESYEGERCLERYKRNSITASNFSNEYHALEETIGEDRAKTALFFNDYISDFLEMMSEIGVDKYKDTFELLVSKIYGRRKVNYARADFQLAIMTSTKKAGLNPKPFTDYFKELAEGLEDKETERRLLNYFKFAASETVHKYFESENSVNGSGRWLEKDLD